jgi:hypothetical protein
MMSWVRWFVRVIAQKSWGATRLSLIADSVHSPSSDG